MKSIVIVADHYPPAFKAGGPAKSASAISGLLSREGFRVRVLARDCDIDGTPLEQIEPVLPHELLPVHGSSVVTRTVRQFLALRALRPDVVYMNSLFSLFGAIFPLIFRRLGLLRNARWILAPRGELMQGALQLKSGKKRLYLGLSKRFGLYRGITWHATSDLEEGAIRRVPGFRDMKIRVVPQLPPESPREGYLPPSSTGGVFISRISRKKNVASLVRAVAQSGGFLDLYGPIEDPGYWHECCVIIEQMGAGSRIKHKGVIRPESVRECITAYRFAALPTYGENFGHAIYEALSVGRPVLIGSDTPFSGAVDGKAGKVVDAHDSGSIAVAYAEMVNASDLTYRTWCRNALSIASEWYSRATSSSGLKELMGLIPAADQPRGRSGADRVRRNGAIDN